MFNLLRGELYKLRKSKSFIICCLIMTLSIFFMYGAVKYAEGLDMEQATENGVQVESEQSDENDVQVENEETAENGVKFEVEVNEEETETVKEETNWIIMMSETMLKGFIILFILIFSCSFISSEYKNGAMKNITGKGYGRGKIFLAKYMATMIGTFLMVVLAVIASVIGGIIFYGTDGMNGEMIKDLMIFTGIEGLLAMGISGVYAVVSEFCRNQGIALGIGFGEILFQDAILLMLDKIFSKWDIQLSKYFIFSIVQEIPIDSFDEKIVIRAMVSLAVTVVTVGLIGIAHFKKTDIK